MPISETLLPEFDHEMANTRKTIERVPDDRLDWKPHSKSWTLRQLTTHLANLPSWTLMTINQDSLDMNPSGGSMWRQEPITSVKEAAEAFDRNVTAARAAIAGASDQKLMETWTLLSAGRVILTMRGLPFSEALSSTI